MSHPVLALGDWVAKLFWPERDGIVFSSPTTQNPTHHLRCTGAPRRDLLPGLQAIRPIRLQEEVESVCIAQNLFWIHRASKTHSFHSGLTIFLPLPFPTSRHLVMGRRENVLKYRF